MERERPPPQPEIELPEGLEEEHLGEHRRELAAQVEVRRLGPPVRLLRSTSRHARRGRAPRGEPGTVPSAGAAGPARTRPHGPRWRARPPPPTGRARCTTASSWRLQCYRFSRSPVSRDIIVSSTPLARAHGRPAARRRSTPASPPRGDGCTTPRRWRPPGRRGRPRSLILFAPRTRSSRPPVPGRAASSGTRVRRAPAPAGRTRSARRRRAPRTRGPAARRTAPRRRAERRPCG